MTAPFRPLAIAMGITVALVILALKFGAGVQLVLAWTLIVLAGMAVWAAAVFWRASRRHPGLEVLRRDFRWAAEIALAEVLVGILAANYLLGSPLPKGSGFVLLSTALMLQNVPLVMFLWSHYRRKA